MVRAIYHGDKKLDYDVLGWVARVLMLSGALTLGACEGLGGSRGSGAEARIMEVDARLAELESRSAADRMRMDELVAQNSTYEEEADAMRAEISRLQVTAARVARLEAQVQSGAAAALGEVPVSSTPNEDGVVMANPEDGGFAVHLASYRVRERAVEGWEDYVGRFPEVISGLDGILAVFDVPSLGGRFFRLKAGPFMSHADAQNFCDQLEALNEYCVVDVYDGEIIR